MNLRHLLMQLFNINTGDIADVSCALNSAAQNANAAGCDPTLPAIFSIFGRLFGLD